MGLSVDIIKYISAAIVVFFLGYISRCIFECRSDRKRKIKDVVEKYNAHPEPSEGARAGLECLGILQRSGAGTLSKSELIEASLAIQQYGRRNPCKIDLGITAFEILKKATENGKVLGGSATDIYQSIVSIIKDNQAGVTLNQETRDYISETWKDRWAFILQSQNQLVNWLFTLHAGGIAGLLTFAATRTATDSVKYGIIAFCLGLIAIIIYGTLMLYLEEIEFRDFKNNVSQLYRCKIDWAEFMQKEQSRPLKHWPCVLAGWSSGLLALIGLGCAALSILF
jgi:hypothetical protein